MCPFVRMAGHQLRVLMLLIPKFLHQFGCRPSIQDCVLETEISEQHLALGGYPGRAFFYRSVSSRAPELLPPTRANVGCFGTTGHGRHHPHAVSGLMQCRNAHVLVNAAMFACAG